jgi:hypothetical protein
VCLLDDEDFGELKIAAGKANRGLHLRIESRALQVSIAWLDSAILLGRRAAV